MLPERHSVMEAALLTGRPQTPIPATINSSKLVRHIGQFRQSPGSQQAPALAQPLLYMRPIHRRVVQADADPARWAQIGRAVVKRWTAFDQHRLFFQSTGLDQQASDAVLMMIVTEIGEKFPAHEERKSVVWGKRG